MFRPLVIQLPTLALYDAAKSIERLSISGFDAVDGIHHPALTR